MLNIIARHISNTNVLQCICPAFEQWCPMVNTQFFHKEFIATILASISICSSLLYILSRIHKSLAASFNFIFMSRLSRYIINIFSIFSCPILHSLIKRLSILFRVLCPFCKFLFMVVSMILSFIFKSSFSIRFFPLFILLSYSLFISYYIFSIFFKTCTSNIFSPFNCL